MNEFVTRKTSYVVAPKNEPLTSNLAITISILNDENDNEMVAIEHEGNLVSVNPSNWHCVRNAIDMLIEQCFGQLPRPKGRGLFPQGASLS